MCLISYTTIPLPDNKPVNITSVQVMDKCKCMYNTTLPQYNNNALHGSNIKIFREKKNPYKLFQGTSSMFCFGICITVISCFNSSKLYVVQACKQIQTCRFWCPTKLGVPSATAGNCALVCSSFTSGVTVNLLSYTLVRPRVI